MPVELSETFLSTAAGWQAMKEARALLAASRVLSSNWTGPLLTGVVQNGPLSYRAVLVIRSDHDIGNSTCLA